MKKQAIKTLLSATLLASFGLSHAATITATAEGAQSVNLVEAPSSIANGDFFIIDRGSNRDTGDGNNEVTSWELDIRKSFGGSFAKVTTFLKADKKLCSANLALVMHPGSYNQMLGDVLGITGLRPIGKDLPFRQHWADTSLTRNINIDLLSRYSEEDINSSFMSYPLGVLQMRYYAGALISKATLTLDYSFSGSCQDQVLFPFDSPIITAEDLASNIPTIPEEILNIDVLGTGDEQVPGDMFDTGNEQIPGIDQFDTGNEQIPGIDQFDTGNEQIPGIDQFNTGDVQVPGDCFDTNSGQIPGIDQFDTNTCSH